MSHNIKDQAHAREMKKPSTKRGHGRPLSPTSKYVCVVRECKKNGGKESHFNHDGE